MAIAQTDCAAAQEGIVTLADGHVVIDLAPYPRTLHVDGLEIHLAPLEKIILFDLAERIGQIVPTDSLAELWGEDSTTSGNIGVHIARLRKKLHPYESSLVTLKYRGFLLLADNFTHLEGRWINLGGLILDLSSGLAIGHTQSRVLAPAQVQVISDLIRKKIINGQNLLHQHIGRLHRALGIFPEIDGKALIKSTPDGFCLGVTPIPIASTLLPAHAKAALGDHSKIIARVKNAFQSAIHKTQIAQKTMPLPQSLPKTGSYELLSYDLGRNLCWVMGQEIKLPSREMTLLAAVICAAQKDAGIAQEAVGAALNCNIQTMRNLIRRTNLEFRNACNIRVVPTPFIVSKYQIMRLTFR